MQHYPTLWVAHIVDPQIKPTQYLRTEYCSYLSSTGIQGILVLRGFHHLRILRIGTFNGELIWSLQSLFACKVVFGTLYIHT